MARGLMRADGIGCPARRPQYLLVVLHRSPGPERLEPVEDLLLVRAGIELLVQVVAGHLLHAPVGPAFYQRGPQLAYGILLAAHHSVPWRTRNLGHGLQIEPGGPQCHDFALLGRQG